MPCSDGGPSNEQVRDQRNIPAMLCALATALEDSGLLDSVLETVDYNEGGITRQWFDYWWADHKVEDQRRRAQERERKEAIIRRAAALNKLTPEERAALGVR